MEEDETVFESENRYLILHINNGTTFKTNCYKHADDYSHNAEYFVIDKFDEMLVVDGDRYAFDEVLGAKR